LLARLLDGEKIAVVCRDFGISRLKQDKPSWGAPKIRDKLSRLYPDVHTPAISTVQ
jgi:hypothetical protein